VRGLLGVVGKASSLTGSSAYYNGYLFLATGHLQSLVGPLFLGIAATTPSGPFRIETSSNDLRAS
jgi:hypothetical protein